MSGKMAKQADMRVRSLTQKSEEYGADTAQSHEQPDDERERHIRYLRLCIEVWRQDRASGHTPFGASLTDRTGKILLKQGNVEVTLPSRDMFACGRKPMEEIGPFPETGAAAMAVREGYRS